MIELNRICELNPQKVASNSKRMIGWAKNVKGKIVRRSKRLARRLKHAGRRAYVSRIARRSARNEKSTDKSVLLMSPSKFPGSLGDEAMLIGACEWLQD